MEPQGILTLGVAVGVAELAGAEDDVDTGAAEDTAEDTAEYSATEVAEETAVAVALVLMALAVDVGWLDVEAAGEAPGVYGAGPGMTYSSPSAVLYSMP